MAVSLVSTGVQFPDATIQTTAASGGSGARSKGSIVFWYGGSNSSYYPVKAVDNLFTTPVTTSIQSNNTQYFLSCVSYSSYYGGWFGLIGNVANVTSTANQPVFSPDGLSWSEIINFRDPINNAPGNVGIVGIGANDADGRIYIMNGNGSIQVSSDNGTTWTAATGSTPNYNYNNGIYVGFRYLNSGTASTSKSVFYTGNNAVTSGFAVAAAGNSNAFTVYTYNFSAPASGAPIVVTTYGTTSCFKSGDAICFYRGTDNATSLVNATSSLNIIYTGNARLAFNASFWCAPNTTSNFISYGSMSGITPVYSGAVSLPAYAGSASVVIAQCVYDGTRWMAITNQGLFYTTNANPSTGWTRAPVNLGTVLPANNNYGRTYIDQRDII